MMYNKFAIPEKQVFLLLSNNHSTQVMIQYEQISRASAPHDTYLVYHQTGVVLPDACKNINCFPFFNSILSDLNYTPISETLIPGSNHFPLLDFYLKNPDYDFYWFIEDDVRFNGQWETLFNYFTGSVRQPDFISCHIKMFSEDPHWFWWHTLRHPSIYIPLYLRIRSFNPIYRISNSALRFIHHSLSGDKWQGHHEVLLPTLLLLEGFDIADFGGTGQFVPAGLENRFYIDEESESHDGFLSTSTMRFRPVIDELKHAGKLYHPVKE